MPESVLKLRLANGVRIPIRVATVGGAGPSAVLLEDFSGSTVRTAIGDATDVLWSPYTGTNGNQSGSLDTVDQWYNIDFTGPVTSTPSSGPYFQFRSEPNDTYAYPDGYAGTYVMSGTFVPTCNRMTFWIRSSAAAPIRRSGGGDTFQFGDYARHHQDTSGDDTGYQGQHYYRLADVNWYADRWRYVSLDLRPQHEVGQATDWTIPVDPENVTPQVMLSPEMATGFICNLTNGSTTVTVTSSSWTIGAGFAGWPLYFGAVSGQTSVSPSACYAATTTTTGGAANATFTLTAPYAGSTASGVTIYRGVNLPSYTYDGTAQYQTPYFDALTRFYCDSAPYGTVVASTYMDGTTWSYDDFYFDSESNAPDSLVATVTCCHTTGDSSGHYEMSWCGRVNITDTYDVYGGTTNLKNTDGSYNGAGTNWGSASSPGSTYVCCYIDSPTMDEAAAMYIMIVPQGQTGTALGRQIKMIQRD